MKKDEISNPRILRHSGGQNPLTSAFETRFVKVCFCKGVCNSH